MPGGSPEAQTSKLTGKVAIHAITPTSTTKPAMVRTQRKRRVVIRFGPPLPVIREAGKRNQAGELTDTLEREVQRLLDEINASR